MKLHERMQNYEHTNRYYLTRKVPVIIRVDGRAFHTFTRGMDKPFDWGFMEAMVQAAKTVMMEATGGVMAYIQSDEASFLLMDTAKLDTMPWFDYRQDKLTSMVASIMTMAFNRAILGHKKFWPSPMEFPTLEQFPAATFDARAFNIPKEDVANYFLHRAQDWERNSIQMLARSLFPHKKLHMKKRDAQLDMIRGRGLNWEELSGREKYGTFLYREIIFEEMPYSHDPIVIRRLIRNDQIPASYIDMEYILEHALVGYHARL